MNSHKAATQNMDFENEPTLCAICGRVEPCSCLPYKNIKVDTHAHKEGFAVVTVHFSRPRLENKPSCATNDSSDT